MALRATTARRYAESVFAIAKDQNSFDRWLEDVATIRGLFTNPDMAGFLANPRVSLNEKDAAVQKLLEGKVDRLALNTALLLVRREQAEAISGLARELHNLINAHRNVAVAEVTTAVELEADQRELVKQRLEVLT